METAMIKAVSKTPSIDALLNTASPLRDIRRIYSSIFIVLFNA